MQDLVTWLLRGGFSIVRSTKSPSYRMNRAKIQPVFWSPCPGTTLRPPEGNEAASAVTTSLQGHLLDCKLTVGKVYLPQCLIGLSTFQGHHKCTLATLSYEFTKPRFLMACQVFQVKAPAEK